jgi:hypothetical protein
MASHQENVPLYADSILVKPTGRTLGSTTVKTYTLQIAIDKEWITTEPVIEDCVNDLQRAASSRSNPKGEAFTFILAEKKTPMKFVINEATKIRL